ncbi:MULTISPECIES: DUF1127 domain-containing protein [unclassified Ruegeria]|uniref:DUF1127 domain-containing protein n=1 Tax=unclassified Ruegeria TaxID=2625375 RepID=UPI001488C26B|nr:MULTISPECIES: DUF1127 domain-containing protein [unclassified Ruegeria]
MAIATHPTSLKSASSSGLNTVLGGLKLRFNRYRTFRQTYNALAALSNRELADLGLNRSMIRRLALQAAEEYCAK